MKIKEALNSISNVARFAYSDALEAQRESEMRAAAKAWGRAEVGKKKLAYLKEVMANDDFVDDAVVSKLEVLAGKWAEAEAGARAAASIAVLANEWDGVKKWAEAKAWAAAVAWATLEAKIELKLGVRVNPWCTA